MESVGTLRLGSDPTSSESLPTPTPEAVASLLSTHVSSSEEPPSSAEAEEEEEMGEEAAGGGEQ